MALISTHDLFVVEYPCDRYSYDTGIPDEVYASREEAQAVADEQNQRRTTSNMAFLRGSDKAWFVQTLYDRMLTVRDNAADEAKSR